MSGVSPVDSAARNTHLGVEKVEQSDGGNQKTGPDEDRLDTEIRLIGADHVRRNPLEDDTGVSWESKSAQSDSQSCTIAAQVERGRVGTETRSRGLAGSDETDRTGGETVTQDPKQQHSQGGSVRGIAFEETGGRETDVEDAHEGASTVVSFASKVFPSAPTL